MAVRFLQSLLKLPPPERRWLCRGLPVLKAARERDDLYIYSLAFIGAGVLSALACGIALFMPLEVGRNAYGFMHTASSLAFVFLIAGWLPFLWLKLRASISSASYDLHRIFVKKPAVQQLKRGMSFAACFSLFALYAPYFPLKFSGRHGNAFTDVGDMNVVLPVLGLWISIFNAVFFTVLFVALAMLWRQRALDKSAT